MSDLGLVDQVFLLGIRKGRSKYPYHRYDLGGACLASLCLNGKVTITKSKKSLVELVDRTPIDDSIIDGCLAQILKKQRRVRSVYWVRSFSSKKHYRKIATQLCDREIIRVDDSRRILAFGTKTYQLIDEKSIEPIVERLRVCIFDDLYDVDIETRLLLAIASAGQKLQLHFDKKQLKKKKGHVAELVAATNLSQSISKAVSSAMAADHSAENAGIIAVSGMGP